MPLSCTYYSKSNIICRIEEDFNSTVGKQKEQFKQKLRCEILELGLQIPARMIQGIDVSPGKVVYKLIHYFSSV
jgi:hypothetical protein